MARLKYLDDWVCEILATPRSQLNARFRKEEVADSIRAIPFYTPYREGFRRVDSDLLRALHTHGRGARCERKIWDGLLNFLEHALPDEVATDLIDRDISVSMLGHSRQSDEVMWRLIPLVAEALLTMARETYTLPERSVEELQQVLGCSSNSGYEWMLNSLSHCRPSSEAKSAAYFRALEGHPKRDEWMDHSINYARDVAPTPEWQAARFDLSHPLDTKSTLLLIGHFEHQDGFLGIARDLETPIEILHLLRDLRGVDSASAIRQAARINLRENFGEVDG